MFHPGDIMRVRLQLLVPPRVHGPGGGGLPLPHAGDLRRVGVRLLLPVQGRPAHQVQTLINLSDRQSRSEVNRVNSPKLQCVFSRPMESCDLILDECNFLSVLQSSNVVRRKARQVFLEINITSLARYHIRGLTEDNLHSLLKTCLYNVTWMHKLVFKM